MLYSTHIYSFYHFSIQIVTQLYFAYSASYILLSISRIGGWWWWRVQYGYILYPYCTLEGTIWIHSHHKWSNLSPSLASGHQRLGSPQNYFSIRSLYLLTRQIHCLKGVNKMFVKKSGKNGHKITN